MEGTEILIPNYIVLILNVSMGPAVSFNADLNRITGNLTLQIDQVKKIMIYNSPSATPQNIATLVGHEPRCVVHHSTTPGGDETGV